MSVSLFLSDKHHTARHTRRYRAQWPFTARRKACAMSTLVRVHYVFESERAGEWVCECARAQFCACLFALVCACIKCVVWWYTLSLRVCVCTCVCIIADPQLQKLNAQTWHVSVAISVCACALLRRARIRRYARAKGLQFLHFLHFLHSRRGLARIQLWCPDGKREFAYPRTNTGFICVWAALAPVQSAWRPWSLSQFLLAAIVSLSATQQTSSSKPFCNPTNNACSQQ